MLTQRDYTTTYRPTWCPGCGNFGIYPATKQALAELQIPPHQVAMSFGIGCSSNGSNFFKTYAFHGIHGHLETAGRDPV
ncbi:MAG: 2-oxoacid:ferredoxin oxidoreductase subunit beta, partial [Patescibacteria group bacterium]